VGKQGEIDYPALIGELGRQHATAKPFSDLARGHYLQQIGMVLDLLPQPPARVLDLGCGTGWTTEFLHRSGYEAVGVDIAPEMIALARTVPERRDIRFEVADYEGIPDLGSFDAVLFFDSLHHAEDERSALAAALAALSPGGIVVLSEPGVGHHLSADALRATEEFGVTEKEMPPSYIISLARQVGFARGRAMPYPFEIADLLDQARESTTLRSGGLSNMTLRSVARRTLAWPVMKALGGRSAWMPTDEAEFGLIRAMKRVTLGFESSGRGGMTVLYK